ncbi:MAG TPA: CvpA family protein [Syntrophomonadaceae bacterium]|nr:CvpA family protein [Syntrophomonadaceae bacterium]
MNVVDCLIITILILSGLSGFRRGLLDSVGRIFGLAAGLLVALAFCSDLSSWLQDKFSLNSLLAIRLKAVPKLNVLDNPLLQLIFPDLPGSHHAYLWLSQAIVIVITFLALLGISSTIITLVWKPLTGLLQHGITGLLNRTAGLLLNVAKNAFILAIIFFTVFPILKGLAAINVSIAAVCTLIEDSKILMWLLNCWPRIGLITGRGV